MIETCIAIGNFYGAMCKLADLKCRILISIDFELFFGKCCKSDSKSEKIFNQCVVFLNIPVSYCL